MKFLPARFGMSSPNYSVFNVARLATPLLLLGQTKWRSTGCSERISARGSSGCPFAFPPATFTDSDQLNFLSQIQTSTPQDIGDSSICQRVASYPL